MAASESKLPGIELWVQELAQLVRNYAFQEFAGNGEQRDGSVVAGVIFAFLLPQGNDVGDLPSTRKDAEC